MNGSRPRTLIAAVSVAAGAERVPAPTAGSAASTRHRRVPRRIPRDVLGVAAVLLLVTIAAWPMVVGGTLVGQDAATQFYPWYAFMGEQLRHWHIPGWNPAQFAGAPFAADPQSGWMYLPAMIFFTLLPLALAAKALIVFHLALAALGAYALARVLGFNLPGAITAGAAFALSGPLFGRSPCCTGYVAVEAWFPIVLLGAEIALRNRDWVARICGWELAALALSQVLADWLGQGSYYVLLALGLYVFFRTVVMPPRRPHPPRPMLGEGGFIVSPSPVIGRGGRGVRATRDRLGQLLLHGGVVLLFGFGLAAGGILPRLAFNGRSTLAGGYGEQVSWAAKLGGITPQMVLHGVLGPTLYYPGGAALILAFAAPLVARRRFGVPYFVTLSLASLVLAAKTTTPLHALLYLVLPKFEELHRHWPERITMVAFLGIALLAGATVSAIASWRRRSWALAGVALLPAIVALVLAAGGADVSASALGGLVAAALLVAAIARWPGARRAVPVLLVLIVCADLVLTGRGILRHGPYGGFHRLNLAKYYQPSGAASFLRTELSGDQFRFFGYDPQLATTEGDGVHALYRYQFADPRTTALSVNNRATVLGLQDVQGYNPIQSSRYVAFMRALNGVAQDYHEANIYSSGLASPLLDLLNVEYIIVPGDTPPNRPDLQVLSADHAAIYADATTKVLVNAGALPRAWIVHAAQRVQPGQALGPLASGAVDPRQVALLETTPPPVAAASDPDDDVADVVAYAADRIQLTARTDAAGLLVLSEIYDPSWHAYVDGKPVQLYEADDILRAVPIPAGTHTVELRYESLPLVLGLAISLATAAVMLLLVGGAVRVAGRRRFPDGSAHA